MSKRTHDIYMNVALGGFGFGFVLLVVAAVSSAVS